VVLRRLTLETRDAEMVDRGVELSRMRVRSKGNICAHGCRIFLNRDAELSCLQSPTTRSIDLPSPSQGTTWAAIDTMAQTP
jgi:hypothetical protein